MEAASFGLLFGCFGAIVVFGATKQYALKRWGTEQNHEAGRDVSSAEATEAAYAQLARLRIFALVSAFVAIGLWFLEPKPYAAGGMAALSCLCLWRAWRVRGEIIERLREESEKRAIEGVVPGIEVKG